MLRKVHLHGRLGTQFGKLYELDCTTPAEAVRALLYQKPGFREALKEGEYRVRVVRKGRSVDFDEQMLTLDIEDAALHITPVVAGRRSKGGMKAILGIVLIGIAIVASGGLAAGAAGLIGPSGSLAFGSMTAGYTLTGWGMVAALGASLLLSGVAMLLAPIPKAPEARSDEDRVFNGVQNVFAQGNPVPLVYGKHLVGSVVVSAGLSASNIETTDTYPWNDVDGSLMDDNAVYNV